MILDVSDLTFSYNSHPVLSDIRFQVKPGELLAILGPNGVGKTTLLKCVNAIHTPRSGAIMVEDRNILNMPPREIASCIGYVAQREHTSGLTVFDAVLMGRTPHIRWRVSDHDLKIVDAALKRLGLTNLALRSIERISGGELQKVAVARALVQEPRLLLLDEPTSSLDLKNQYAILSMVRHVVEEHEIAAIMTMHDLNLALRFAHKYICLKNGSIQSAGHIKDISAEVVRDVYGVPVEIHHIRGCPTIFPLH